MWGAKLEKAGNTTVRAPRYTNYSKIPNLFKTVQAMARTQ